MTDKTGGAGAPANNSDLLNIPGETPTLGQPDTQDTEEFLPGYKTREDALAALNKVSDLEQRVAQMGSLQEGLNGALRRIDELQATRQPARQEPPIDPMSAYDWDSIDLTDPDRFKAGLKTGLGRVVNTMMKSAREETARATEAGIEAQIQGQHQAFMAEHPEFRGKNEFLVQAAVHRESLDLSSRGINARQAATRREFWDRVGTQLKDYKPNSVGGQSEVPPADGRTGGTSGGSRPVTRTTPPAAKGAPRSMADELLAQQRKNGLR